MRMLLIAAGVAVMTVACGTQPTVEPDLSGQRQLGPRYGISVSLPESWYGRLSRGALVTATFPVPQAGSIGLREMAFPQLEGDDARVLLFEAARENRSPPTDSSEYPHLEGDLRFEAAAFGPDDGNSEDSRLTGHGFARKTFQMSGRLFVVFVETGSLPPNPTVLEALNELLASIEIEPGDFYPGTVEPARFAARPGWHVGDSGPDEVDADGEFTTSWATTAPFADEWNALPPFRTLERLPRDGIVIRLGLYRTNRFPSPKDIRTAPFQLEELERRHPWRRHPWQGQVRDLPEHVLWGTLENDIHLDLRVYFGRPDPSKSMRAEAQAMLDGLELPDWGPWELEP